MIGETAPVPFVTAFVSQELRARDQRQVREALLAVGTEGKLLTALETLTGFEPISEKELKAAEQRPADRTVPTATTAPAGTTSYLTPAVPQGDSWPGWRGQNRDGHSGWLPAHLPSELEIVWQKPLTGPGLAGVAANQRYVVLADRDLNDLSDEFRCYSAAEGELLWTCSYPAPGRLDYGNTPRATPLIDGPRVYLHGAFGDLHCVELATGTILWSKNYALDFGATAELPWGTCGSPLLAGGKLIINPGAPDASLVALDPQTGGTLWQTPGGEPAYGSFVAGELGGVQQVVGHDAKSLGGWDLSTGKQLWKLVPAVQEDFSVPTPVIVDGKLLVTSENNGTRVYEFDATGKIVLLRWRSTRTSPPTRARRSCGQQSLCRVERLVLPRS